MDRLLAFFQSRSFAVLLFHIGVLVFNWPLFSLASGKGELSIFKYILIAWFVIVCLLIVMGYCINRIGKPDNTE